MSHGLRLALSALVFLLACASSKSSSCVVLRTAANASKLSSAPVVVVPNERPVGRCLVVRVGPTKRLPYFDPDSYAPYVILQVLGPADLHGRTLLVALGFVNEDANAKTRHLHEVGAVYRILVREDALAPWDRPDVAPSIEISDLVSITRVTPDEIDLSCKADSRE